MQQAISEPNSREEQSRLLIDLLPEAIAVHAGGKVLFANPAAAKLMGAARPEDLIGLPIIGFVHPDFRALAIQRIRQVSDRGGVGEPVAEKFLRLDGATVDVEVTSMSITFEGQPAIQVIARDMSERRRAEEQQRRHTAELEDWKKRHDAIVRASGQVLYSSNQRTGEVRWFGNVKAVFGYDVLPNRIDDAAELIHPEDRPRFHAEFRRVVATRTPFHLGFRMRHASGAYLHVENDGYYVHEGSDDDELVGFVVDVTARVEAETAARRASELYRNLFNGLPLGMYRTTPAGMIEDANPAYARLAGYPDPESLLNVNVASLYADPSDRGRLRSLMARDGTARGFECGIKQRDGTIRQISVSGRSVNDAAGNLLGYEGIVEDITERKAMERDLREARDAALESTRLKSAFLANTSHEIRTPLNVMLGLIDFVAEHLEEIGDRTQDQYIVSIRRASRRLLTTIRSIIDLSKIETHGFELRPKLIDAAQVVEQQVKEFEPIADRKGLELTTEIEPGEMNVVFDDYCFAQALGNLLDNAIKFTHRGRVSVRLGRRDAQTLCLVVEDTGVGIDSAFLARLFDPFSQEEHGYTRAFEGSGLGLALVQNYLRMNGASIEVESEKGKGSRFRILLPAVAAHVDEASLLSGPENASSEDRKPLVLVVEDDEFTQAFMGVLLGKQCSVLYAADGSEFRQHLTARRHEIDLILMDLSLKGREDGLDLVRLLREGETASRLAVIAVTAHALPQDRQRAIEAGCDEYVVKPIDKEELFAKMSQLLGPKFQPATQSLARA